MGVTKHKDNLSAPIYQMCDKHTTIPNWGFIQKNKIVIEKNFIYGKPHLVLFYEKNIPKYLSLENWVIIIKSWE